MFFPQWAAEKWFQMGIFCLLIRFGSPSEFLRCLLVLAVSARIQAATWSFGGLMNCAEYINFWLSVCRCFSKRKPIFYYYSASMLDVPTFCWFPWADVPSASISFLYLSDSFLFSLKLWLKCFQLPLIFQRLLWKVLLFFISFLPSFGGVASYDDFWS